MTTPRKGKTPPRHVTAWRLRIDKVPNGLVQRSVGGVEALAHLGRDLMHAEVQAVVTAFYFDRNMVLQGYLEVGRGGVDGALHDLTGRETLAAGLITHAHAIGVVAWKPWPTYTLREKAFTDATGEAAYNLGLTFIDYVVAAEAGWTGIAYDRKGGWTRAIGEVEHVVHEAEEVVVE